MLPRLFLLLPLSLLLHFALTPDNRYAYLSLVAINAPSVNISRMYSYTLVIGDLCH